MTCQSTWHFRHRCSMLQPLLDDLHVLPLAPSVFALVIDLAKKPAHSCLELVHGHSLGLVVDVKECASVPEPFLQKNSLATHPIIERGAGKRRHHGNLHFEEARAVDELLQTRDDVRCVALQPQDETPVDGDTVGLDSLDGFQLAVAVFLLPAAWVNSDQILSTETLQTHKDLPAAAFRQEVEELVVVRH